MRVSLGAFPTPMQLAPNRVGWQVEMVEAWLEQRKSGLLVRAVKNPDDLAPEELVPTIQQLGAAVIEVLHPV